MSFKHDPLDHTRPSIRLIEVASTKSPEGFIQCRIIHSTTDAKYTCLSYVWGDEHNRGGPLAILINGKQLAVRYNLHAFLEVAMARYSKEVFWIDALSIDQENLAERNHQVQQMGDIYSHAHMVVAWLGNDEAVEVVIAMLRVVASRWPPLRRIDKRTRGLARQGQSSDGVEFNFALEEYWSRAWITQEIALASRVKLLAGETEWNMSAASKKGLFRARQLCDPHRRTGFTQVQSLATERYEATSKSLFGLLSRFSDKKCSVRRDRIFSLLSLCSEGSTIQVDYGVSDLHLLFRTLEKSGSTSCLCYAAIGVYALDLTTILRDDLRGEPALSKPFAEFETSRVYTTVPSPENTAVPVRCNNCWSNMDSMWYGQGNIMFCLSLVCPETRGHLCWIQPNSLEAAVSTAQKGWVHYVEQTPSEGENSRRSLGQMGEQVTIIFSSEENAYMIRLTLSVLLEIFLGKSTSSRPPVPCGLSFRNHRCNLILSKDNR
jgi:hypothetical protein